tara:strand:+ start:2952 stop:3332 length:381 start_codon:yes stop_codon:yes gene_type:complete
MLNRLTIIGNLTKDPELRKVSDSMCVCKFSIAVNNAIKKSVLYLDVECWNRTAINCHKFLKKGSSVSVDGRLELNQWQSKTGENRSKIYCVADLVHFLRSEPKTDSTPQTNNAEVDMEEDEDEVPF